MFTSACRMACALGAGFAVTVTAAAGEQLTGTLVVLNKAEATASLLDCATGKEIARLATGDGPHEVAVSPDGRTAVVADYGRREPGRTLTVLDLPNQRVIKTIDLKSHHRPHGIQYLPDGKRVAVTTEQEQFTLVVNVETGGIEHAIKTGQRVSHMLVLSPKTDRIYVTSIGSGTATVIDLNSAEVIATIETGGGAEGLDVTPDGRELWVANRGEDTISVIDTATLAVAETIPCGVFPIRLKFTLDGKHALVSNARSGDLAVFDTATRKELRRIAMKEKSVDDTDERLFGGDFAGGPVPVGILVAPGGRRAFVANTNADIVTVIDLQTWKIAGRLKAGKEPDGLAYSPLELNRD